MHRFIHTKTTDTFLLATLCNVWRSKYDEKIVLGNLLAYTTLLSRQIYVLSKDPRLFYLLKVLIF
jgi:hypothetical protein